MDWIVKTVKKVRWKRQKGFVGLVGYGRMVARGMGVGLCLVGLGACSSIGAEKISMNQLDYGSNLNVGSNKQALLNIVKMRYGESPTFLSLTQIISGYSLQNQFESNIGIFPWASSSNNGLFGGQVQYNESPTFTLAPIVGKEFANTFIKPLDPVELLPLINADIPSDLLLKLSLQSIAGYENMVSFGSRLSGGTLPFFKVVGNINTLQKEGLLNFTVKNEDKVDHIYMTLLDSSNPELQQVVRQTRALLRLDENFERPALIVYGRKAEKPNQIPIITRPVLSIMSKVAMQIDVPEKQINDHLTFPSVKNTVDNQRPSILIQVGTDCPEDAYTCVLYRGNAFWIANNDVLSKFGFMIIRLLIDLAQEKTTNGAVVTIPSTTSGR